MSASEPVSSASGGTAAGRAPGQPLRVGLNLVFLGERAGGAGRYARELAGALLAAEPATELHVFLSADAPADIRREPWANDVRWVTLPIHLSGAPTHVPAEYLAIPPLAAARRLDVIHSPANTGPTRTPGVASVVSVLDLIWLHRPWEWEASPRVHSTMRRRVGRAVRHADAIFSISDAAASDLVQTLGVERERIHVTPLGARLPPTQPTPEAQLRATLDLGDARVLLCVAQKRPYKNLGVLIGALPSLSSDVVLVLPGSPTAYEHELRALAEQLGVAGRVRFPDWLSDGQLEGLYALSDVFALPSLIEGFGLPVVEAMLRGLPVACASCPALAEVAGEAALTFDPERQQEVDVAIGRLFADRELARRLALRGRERAAEYTWERTGRLSLAGYRRAIEARRSG
jgi:glycosyltransferase involved in cell wall biosynthesis